MTLGPGILGAGAKTRLESSIKKLKPHLLMILFFQVIIAVVAFITIMALLAWCLYRCVARLVPVQVWSRVRVRVRVARLVPVQVWSRVRVRVGVARLVPVQVRSSGANAPFTMPTPCCYGPITMPLPC